MSCHKKERRSWIAFVVMVVALKHQTTERRKRSSAARAQHSFSYWLEAWPASFRFHLSKTFLKSYYYKEKNWRAISQENEPKSSGALTTTSRSPFKKSWIVFLNGSLECGFCFITHSGATFEFWFRCGIEISCHINRKSTFLVGHKF